MLAPPPATSMVLPSLRFAEVFAGSSFQSLSVFAFPVSCPDLNRFSGIETLQGSVHPGTSNPRNRRPSNMLAERTKDFQRMYSSWFGKPVVVCVLIRRCHFPMACHIVSESATDVRVRIRPG